MTLTAPASLSVYRGQSRRGIGEGPGRPVTQGEQYLGASAPIGRDADLLDAIRPWMSLDSDPADHQKLGDLLEGWSFFKYGKRQLVVRLVSAGIYDRRAAYFAHGRLWPLDSGPGFDPGLHIGRSEAFETSWRDDDPGRRVPELLPALAGVRQIEAEPKVAALFLAHLLQSCVRRRPLVVLAPLSEFAVGAPLHSLLSFARGALPADLREECRVRIYTRTPELFLRDPEPAALVAMPDDLQDRRVQSVRRDARLIDRQGRLLAGEPLEPVAQAYAEAVLERALRIPEGLSWFGERFRDRCFRTASGLPDERDVRAIQITYNLPVALASSTKDRGDFFQSYLPRVAHKLGPEVDWPQLITAEEWWTFPLEPVLDLLLMDSQALSPGMRELQKAAERTMPLKQAAERGAIDPLHVQTLLQTAPISRLTVIAQELLQASSLFESQQLWGDVLARLLEALRRMPHLPADMAAVLVQSLVREGELRYPWLESLAPQWIQHQDLLQALGVGTLLKLANVLETRDSLQKVFDFVDIHMMRDPRTTADALVQTGWWTAWRRMSGLMVRDSEEKRRAAEAWLTSRVWTGDGAREATREDWNQVMHDLPSNLYAAGRPAPWSSGQEPRRLWPWIPPFEEEQIADLADRAPDLPSLAVLADVLQKDFSRPDVGASIYRFLLGSSRFKSSFEDKDALAWLLDNPPAGLFPLSLKDSFQLWLMAGPREARALQARLASICHCLKKDQQAEPAIHGADHPPLWDKAAFAEALVSWMHERGSVDRIGWEIAEKIENQIAAEPVRRPKQVNQQLVLAFAGRNLRRCALLFDPDLPDVAPENLVESVIDALATGEHGHPCWQVLAAKIASDSTGTHPLSSVAERVRSETGERRAALVRTGWSTFEAAAQTEPILTYVRPNQAGLPIFDLAASLSEPGGLGNAALGVIFSANPSQKRKSEWWDALLRELFRWRRYPSLECPEDRPDVAIALVVRLLDDLETEERQGFWGALGQRNERDLLAGTE